MADMTSVLNAIQANGGTDYASRVPQATRDNITAVGNAILDLQATTETFLNLLVNRIAMTIVRNKTFKNPLSILKKGGIPLGNTVQDIYTNPAKANTFDPTGNTLLSRTLPDTKVLYHSKNRQDQYEVTFSKPQLQQAFTSYAELEKLLNGVVASLYSGDNIDEFAITKNLIGSAITNNRIKTIQTADITTSDGAKKLVKDLKTLSSAFQYPSSKFNSYLEAQPEGGDTKAAITWTPKDDQILILRSDIATEIDVEVLAQAFNMDKAALIGNILEVDNFDSVSSCYGVIADKSAFQIYDNLQSLESFYNPKGMYWNYYYNHWQTYSLSLFANAVALIYEATPSGI